MKTSVSRLLLLFMAGCLALTACKGKVKDSDIQQAISEKVKTLNGLSNVSATVNEGVATLTGECADESARTAYEDAVKAIPGVKQVVNNCTVAPPPPPPVTISPDDTLKAAVDEAIKVYSGVKANVSDGVVTLTGEIKRASLTPLMAALNALKPKKIENKLTIK